MSTPAKTALDFCCKCLGWAHPVDRMFAERNLNSTGDGGSQAWTPYIFDYDGKHDQFHYTDLNAVLAAVRGWCDANEAAVEIGFYVYIPGDWEVQVVTPISVESVQCIDLSQALLAACVAASRKLNGAV